MFFRRSLAIAKAHHASPSHCCHDTAAQTNGIVLSLLPVLQATTAKQTIYNYKTIWRVQSVQTNILRNKSAFILAPADKQSKLHFLIINAVEHLLFHSPAIWCNRSNRRNWFHVHGCSKNIEKKNGKQSRHTGTGWRNDAKRTWSIMSLIIFQCLSFS